jgi:hypothetical protein
MIVFVSIMAFLLVGTATYLICGVKEGRRTRAAKLATLQTLIGEKVALGIGARAVFDTRGVLQAVDAKRATLLTDAGKPRAYPIANIRWLYDSSGERRGTW